MSGAVGGTTDVTGVAEGEPDRASDAAPGPESLPDTGTRLDDHHAPETNGRMAICRRCGCLTESAVGRTHAPDPHQLVMCGQWLDGQERANRVGRAREVPRT
jgi:hypothetical protein